MTEIKDLKELDKFLAQKQKERKASNEKLKKSKERAKTLKGFTKIMKKLTKAVSDGTVEKMLKNLQ
jgi:hypothetical protein